MTTSQTSQGISTRFDGMQFVVESESEAEVYDLEYLVAVMLVAVARSDGTIDPAETGKMMQMIDEYFRLKGSTSLELLTRAVKQLAESPDLTQLLRGWSDVLTELDKEDIAVMMLKVVDADGKRDASEMAMLHKAAEIIGISSESLHNAFNRFFDELDRT